MNTLDRQYVAVDVSMKKHNYVYPTGEGKFSHGEFQNQKASIDQWIDRLPFSKDQLFIILEKTGVYSDLLMHELNEKGINFAVINPLQSRAMAKLINMTTKNDKQDALMLLTVGQKLDLMPYHMPSNAQKRRKEMLSALNSYQKVQSVIANQVHAFTYRVNPDQTIIADLKETLNIIEQKIEKVKEELGSTLEDDESKELVKRICSIKSIGKTTAVALITQCGNLNQFENVKQFTKHLGLAPGENTSGISVRGRSKVPKRGGSEIRKCLFNCARNAIQYNERSIELYLRMKNRGRNGKQALTAVTHELARIIFGVVKSGHDYDPNYLENRKLTA